MPAPRRRRRFVAALLLAVLVTGTLTVSGASTAGAQTGAAAAWTASPTRPFSDPLWLPVREPAIIWCVLSNGCPNDEHGYWAIDFIGERGDPVHAAGAGVFHVGAVDGSCSSTVPLAGTWAWIDHGGGVITRYGHLDGITATEGQLVTPATQIGTMGHSGDIAPCSTDYLHFEVRTGGLDGARVNPGQLAGCTGATRRSFPAEWGYASWNSVYRGSRTTPALDGSCLPSSVATTTPPTSVKGTRGDRSTQLSWAPPSSGAATVDRYVVTQEVWSPSINAWKAPTYRTVASSARSTTFTGLVNGARYRHRVVAHNVSGNSAWSPYVEVVPAAAPLAPGHRALTSGTTWVRLGWTNGTAQGTPITSFTVCIRRLTGSGWTAWQVSGVPATERTRRWDGLLRGKTYEVKVRANSTAGPSTWTPTRRIATTP